MISSCTFFSTWAALADNGGSGEWDCWEEEDEELDVKAVGVAAALRELQISNCRIHSESGRSTSICL